VHTFIVGSQYPPVLVQVYVPAAVSIVHGAGVGIAASGGASATHTGTFSGESDTPSRWAADGSDSGS
jgi:hypothetical protein